MSKRFYIFLLAVLILILLNLKFAVSQETIHTGLHFISNDHNIKERTTFTVTQKNQISFRHRFELSFDINIYNPRFYGYICRLIDDEIELSLLFIPFRSTEYVYFDVVVNNEIIPIQIPVHLDPDEMLPWNKISLILDLDSDSLFFSFNNFREATTLKLPSRYSPKIVFGLYGTNLDVPGMEINDIRLFDMYGNLKLHFPLNEYQGNQARDNISGKRTEIINPDWIAKDHYYWKEVISFESNKFAGITFNSLKDEIMIVGTDSLMIVSAKDFNLQVKHYQNNFPLGIEYHSSYNPVAKNIITYIFDNTPLGIPKKRIASLNTDKMLWENILDAITFSKQWHHNVLFIPDLQYPVVFGGYGRFLYYNEFITFNEETLNWEEISFSGDTIYPRFFSAVTQYNDSVFYIFGGFGNHNGLQELGGFNYYDLYRINTRSLTINRLWELPLPKEEHFVPAGTMYYDERTKAIFVLCYPHHIPQTNLSLYKFKTDTPRYAIVSSNIPMTSEKILTEAKLFYSQSTGELLTVLRDNMGGETSHFRIYSLRFPPVNVDLLYADAKISENRLLDFILRKWLYLVPAIIFFSLMLLFINRKRKWNIHTRQFSECLNEKKLPLRNAIFMFGTFQVFDKNGKDVTYHFSPKLRQVLVLILTTQLDEGNGISSAKLSTLIWPEKEINEAKNIRSVTISHLRSALECLEGIELVHDNSYWKFLLREDIFIDYREALKLNPGIYLSNKNDNISMEFAHFLCYISRGSLLIDMEEEWLDKYKSQIETKTLDILYENAVYCKSVKNYSASIYLTNLILVLIPFNEEAFELKIQVLMKMGGTPQARNTFLKYVKNYEKIYGQESSLSFDDIVNK